MLGSVFLLVLCFLIHLYDTVLDQYVLGNPWCAVIGNHTGRKLFDSAVLEHQRIGGQILGPDLAERRFTAQVQNGIRLVGHSGAFEDQILEFHTALRDKSGRITHHNGSLLVRIRTADSNLIIFQVNLSADGKGSAGLQIDAEFSCTVFIGSKLSQHSWDNGCQIRSVRYYFA